MISQNGTRGLKKIEEETACFLRANNVLSYTHKDQVIDFKRLYIHSITQCGGTKDFPKY